MDEESVTPETFAALMHELLQLTTRTNIGYVARHDSDTVENATDKLAPQELVLLYDRLCLFRDLLLHAFRVFGNADIARSILGRAWRNDRSVIEILALEGNPIRFQRMVAIMTEDLTTLADWRARSLHQ